MKLHFYLTTFKMVDIIESNKPIAAIVDKPTTKKIEDLVCRNYILNCGTQIYMIFTDHVNPLKNYRILQKRNMLPKITNKFVAG